MLESLIASGAMDELEGTRAQKWAVIEQALSFSSAEQRDRKKGQTTLFDLFSEDENDKDYFPPLPTLDPWTYLHQLEKEKEVLGFYMSGHPLFEYKILIKYLTNANSQTAKSRSNGELMLAGIVCGITKKKDNKGNPIAFVEFEDLAGRFEVPLFNRDYQQYQPLMIVGKVFYLIGTKSSFNGNDDGLLRLMPQAMIPFDSLANQLKGELRISISFEQMKKGYLKEIASMVARQGNFKLITNIQTEDLNSYQLISRKLVFPSDKILTWLEKEKIEFQLKVFTSEKNS